VPLLDCVKQKDGKMIAYFGYRSEANSEVTIPIGASNRFSPAPDDRGQPTTFLPGRIANAVTVTFDGDSLTWKLGGKSARADDHSPRCSECEADQCSDACEYRSPGDFKKTMFGLFRDQRKLFFDLRDLGGKVRRDNRQYLNSQRIEAFRLGSEARQHVLEATQGEWHYCWSESCAQDDVGSHIAELRDINGKMQTLIEDMAVFLKKCGVADSDIAGFLTQADDLKKRIDDALRDCPRFVSRCN
jgi:hypothetical protein